MNPRSFVSPRHKSRGDPRSRTGLQNGQAIMREGAQRPVINVYIYTYIYVKFHPLIPMLFIYPGTFLLVILG